MKRLPFKIRAFLAILLLSPAAAWAQNINGTTGQFSFPQNRDNPYGIHASVYNNQDVIDAYNKWYADCVTSSGAGGYLRVQRPNDSGLNLNSTVSEGIGYAMVIAVYMNDENLFDNIWKYEQLHLDGNGLMNWYIDASGATDGSGAATDADEDMAWALLMAARQWGGSGTLGSSYQSLAVAQINRIYNTELSSGIPDGGDSFGSINPSYFAPAYYREFASATGQSGWLSVAANCYTVLSDNLGQGYGNAANGLDSAWCTNAGVSTPTNAAPYDYQYDACRTPFRMTEDYLWFGTTASQSYATLTSNFFSGVGAVSIVDGYYLNGTPHPHLPTLTVSQNPGTQSAAFVGPAGVGGMVSHTYQQFLDNDYEDLVGSKLLVGGTYYDESWTVMSLLMMSGNFLDYNLYTTPTPTPTLTAYAPLTIRVNAGGPTFTDSAGAAWSADQQFGGTNTWGYDGATSGSTSTYTSTITNTVNNQQTLYQTERWGNPLYRFTVPNGYYQVTLKFCENYDADSHVGGRVFSVAAEGNPVITNLDVYQAAGDAEHRAYDVAVTVAVTDGELDLAFSATADSSQVNAIQVLRITTPPTPTLTPTKTITPTNTPTALTATPTATPTETGTPPPATPTLTFTPVYVDAASSVNYVSASSGITWVADQAYSAGSWGYVGGTAYSSSGPISNSLDPSLYLTERAASSFQYIFSSVPAGTYDLTLLFAETSHTAAGQRVFSVTAGTTTLLSNFDIYAAAGGKNIALPESFTITQAATGPLTISFNASVDVATLQALSLVRVTPLTATPTATPTRTLTSTVTATSTATPSSTATSSPTETATPTSTASSTSTPTVTPTTSPTSTASTTSTATFSPTATPSQSATGTETPTMTSTLTPTMTATDSPARTLTPTPSFTSTPMASSTPSMAPTVSDTPTASLTPTPSATPTDTLSSSPTPSATFSPTDTPTLTATVPASATPSFTPTASASPTPTMTPAATATNSPTFTMTATWTPVPASTQTPTPTSMSPVPQPVLYPNPISGPGPVRIRLPEYDGVADVSVKVYTTAFRKVENFTAAYQMGGSDIFLPLAAQDGTAFANGLYYVVVTTPDGTAILKLLILH